jgi:hypothetical protein
MSIVGIVAISPLWIPLLLCVVLFRLLSSICLHLAVWLLWLPRSKRLLFVYSNSPIWQSYVEAHILPVIREQAVILNWSQRREWPLRHSLAVAVFKHFGGYREFNPMAVVFRPLRLARVFRFFQPFQDFKHGKPDSLTSAQNDLFCYLRANEIRPNA